MEGQLDAVPPGFFTVGEGICRGDSGSPVLFGDNAVVGVASALSRADGAFDGTAADCMGELVRGKYQRIDAMSDQIVAAFVESDATPWLEGEPDPRDGLAEIDENCEIDSDCRSTICVIGEPGDRVCSYGCLSKPCPARYDCRDPRRAEMRTPCPRS